MAINLLIAGANLHYREPGMANRIFSTGYVNLLDVLINAGFTRVIIHAIKTGVIARDFANSLPEVVKKLRQTAQIKNCPEITSACDEYLTPQLRVGK